MQVYIFAFSDKGCVLAQEISTYFSGSSCYSTEKFAGKYDLHSMQSLSQTVGELFKTADLLIFVGACGIAVRAIAPFVKNKTTDPACVVVDDCGQFVIPILSGHIGGGNDYAQTIATKLGATTVITTATDINNKFSVDVFAAKNGFAISNMSVAKDFSATILTENLPVCFADEVAVNSHLDKNLYKAESGKLGLYIGYKKEKPFDSTLRLTPKMIIVGIGCRRGTTQQAIADLFAKTFEQYNLDTNAVKLVTSIDIKSDEQGLLDFCACNKYDVQFYSADQLNAVEGQFEGSDFVKKTTGVDNVCERAAALGGGKIIVHKTSLDGVTIAVAVKDEVISFE